MDEMARFRAAGGWSVPPSAADVRERNHRAVAEPGRGGEDESEGAAGRLRAALTRVMGRLAPRREHNQTAQRQLEACWADRLYARAEKVLQHRERL